MDKALTEAKEAYDRERVALRELQAKQAGVAIGDIVTWTKGRASYRGRVTRFTGKRYYYGPGLGPLALTVVLIRKSDGEEGASEVVDKWEAAS